MEESMILQGIYVSSLMAAMAVFGLIWILYGGLGQTKKVLATYKEFYSHLRLRQKESDHYKRLECWLIQNGAPFHYGKNITPTKYLLGRILLGLLGACIVSPLLREGSLIVGGILFLLPNGLLIYLNGKDNERLLPELKLIYNAMELQIKAGVYVTDALAECYGNVREVRLHTALLDLAGDIALCADIFDALDRFQGKFDNRYVDSLCITILQALESGQAVELLRDVSEQIKDMEQTLLERKKAALDRSLTFYQLIVLCVVLGVALYACVSKLLGAATQL